MGIYLHKIYTATRGAPMKTFLVLAIFIIFLQFFAMLILLYRNYKLTLRIRTFNDVKLWHTLAFKDDLTGIYNRTAYGRHISEIEKMNTTRGFAIMLFDIDNFKKINDTRGHLAGDEALKSISKALTSVFSSSEYSVYRIGGDEFAVIAENTTEGRIIDRLLKLESVLKKSGLLRLSKGYSMIAGSVKAAFKNADEMLYADKASKK